MDDVAVRVEYDKDRETEALWIVETLHQSLCLF